MNFSQIKRAYLSGHVIPEATGSHTFQMSIGGLCGRGRNDFLAQDLVAEINALLEQMQTLQVGSNWALVCDYPCPTLTFRTVAIECPNAATDAKSNDPGRFLLSEAAGLSASEESAPDQQSMIPEVSPEPKSIDPNEATASSTETSNIESSSFGFQSSHTEIPLQITSDENSETATLLAAEILASYHRGSLTNYEQVEAEIYKSPLPGLTRNIVANVNKKWKPTSSTKGIIHWEDSLGIHDPLPLSKPLGVTAYVVGVGTDNLGKLLVQTLHQPAFASLVSESVVGSRKYLPITIATADITSVLAYAMAHSLIVRVALSAERRIASGARASFVAIAAHCVAPTDEEERERIRQLAVMATRRPDQADLWGS